MPHRHNNSDSTFHELVERIAERVRPVCRRIPEPEFRLLIEQMARVEQKYLHHPSAVPKKLEGDAGWPESGDDNR
jgi:hypothetical protein